MGGKSKYQSSWANGIIKRPWLKPVSDSQFSAHCSVCVVRFKVDNGGVSQVKRHEATSTHTNNVKKRDKEKAENTKLVANGHSELVLTKEQCEKTLQEKVLSAEVYQALNIVDKNQSFQSTDGDNERFRLMFPDSEIAKLYQQSATKSMYVVKYGLAPYAKEDLLRDIAGEQYCFHFDETTTSQVKKQYDGYLTYYSKTEKNVTTSYAGSLFLGRCTAKDLVRHFYDFIEGLGLELDYVLNIGMDGPNVNKKFEADLKQELEMANGNSFVSCGSCPLHTVHNGFGKGMTSLKEAMNLDQFVIDLHFFFERSSARREDFKKMSSITDVSVHYLLRHCESRWLSIERVLVRVIEQFDNITTYFLSELPGKQEFKGKNGVGQTKRYNRIATCLKDQSLLPLMGFVVFIAQDFKKFLIPLQTSAPMIHVLHTMQIKLVHSLLSKFIDAKHITKNDGDKILSGEELKKIQVSNPLNHISKYQIGAKATYTLKGIDALEKKKIIRLMITFLEECTDYLLKNLSLHDPVLRKAICLHPENRQVSSSLEQISSLCQVINKALGEEAMHKTFKLSNNQTKFDLLDIIRREFMEYQTENIPKEFYVEQKLKKSTCIQKGYWKRAYEIAGVLEDDDDDDEGNEKFKRIDDYWQDILQLKDENGKRKYVHLWTLVKCVLLISHGNADPERGFSINKHLLKIHGFSTAEDTIVAIRFVKDFIIKCGGSEKIPMSKKLLQSCKLARSKYELDLEAKKSMKIKEEAAKKAALEAEAQKNVAVKAKKEKEGKIREIEKEISSIELGISVADKSILEANEATQSCLKENVKLSKAELVTQMQQCQSKAEMGLKRKKELTEDKQKLLKKKSKLEKT